MLALQYNGSIVTWGVISSGGCSENDYHVIDENYRCKPSYFDLHIFFIFLVFHLGVDGIGCQLVCNNKNLKAKPSKKPTKGEVALSDAGPLILILVLVT